MDDITTLNTQNNPVFSLAELSMSLKKTVETSYSHVRVKAEVSRPVTPASGHLYFTLKDGQATLDAVCWKNTSLAIKPEDGLEVIASGRLTTYPGRSKYQIIVTSLEIAGEGAILKQIEERKKRLASEGLFDDGRKKPIPKTPKTIAVITSPTGAVIRDIIHRISDRFPVHIMVWPVRVQGNEAAAEITNAIKGLDTIDALSVVPIPDIVIIARGGGSIEDLMPFNDEAVVRAIADAKLPIITAIGHETDNSLADLAADFRAPTPTAAAEIATPLKSQLDAKIRDLDARLVRNLGQTIERAQNQIRNLGRALGKPDDRINNKAQSLDILSGQLAQKWQKICGERRQKLSIINGKLVPPDLLLSRADARVQRSGERLTAHISNALSRPKTQLQQAEKLLEAKSFLRILDKGFAIVKGADGAVMKQSNQYKDGEIVEMIFAQDSRKTVLKTP